MRFVSYNLDKCAAVCELPDLVEEWQPDVLCVQECESAGMPERLGDLQLAGNTVHNRLGLAVYLRQGLFSVLECRGFALTKSFHDQLFAPAAERLLTVRVRESRTAQEMMIGSFHGAPLTARNALRRQQIDDAHADMLELGGQVPTLMAGDFNYPCFKGALRRHLKESGYELELSSSATYRWCGLFAGRFDLVTRAGFDVVAVEVLRKGGSDHRPILFEAEPIGTQHTG